MKYKIIFSIGILFILAVVVFDIKIANHKLLWYDEGNEIEGVCQSSFIDLLHKAPGAYEVQISVNPLYYFLQKIVVGWAHQDSQLSFGLLIKYRTVSLCAAFVVLLISLGWMTKRVGVVWATFFLAALTSQMIVHHYAAESRPYMLWFCLFAALLFVTVDMILSCDKNGNRKQYVLFYLVCITLCLVARPGFMQSLAAIFFVFLSSKENRKKMIPIFVICVALGVYFNWLSHAGLKKAVPGELADTSSLLGQIQRGDWRGVNDLRRLILPEQFRDATAMMWLFNGLFVVGLFLPLFLWKHRSRFSKVDQTFFTLNLAAIFQIIAGLIIIFAAADSIFFSRRRFIFLVACYAVMVTTGAYFILSHMKKKELLVIAISMVSFVLCIMQLKVSADSCVAYYKHMQLGYPNTLWGLWEPWPAQFSTCQASTKDSDLDVPCETWQGDIEIYGEKSYSIPLNVQAVIGNETKRCGWKNSNQSTRVLIPKSEEIEKQGRMYTVSKGNISEENQPLLSVCGKKCLFSKP